MKKNYIDKFYGGKNFSREKMKKNRPDGESKGNGTAEWESAMDELYYNHLIAQLLGYSSRQNETRKPANNNKQKKNSVK